MFDPTPTELTFQQYRMRPGNLIRRVAKLSVVLFNREAADLNLTRPQFGALWGISRRPGIDQITLARSIGVDRSTTTLLLDGLMDRGLIRREVDPQDRRRRVLDLNDLGWRHVREAVQRAQRAEASLISPLLKQEQAEFIQLLQRIVLETPSNAPAFDSPLRDDDEDDMKSTPLLERPGYLLRRCTQIGIALFGERLKDLDITALQYGTMFFLKVMPADEATTARLIGCERSTCDRMLLRLKDRGYVERVKDGDRSVIRLTNQGDLLFQEARRLAMDDEDPVLQAIAPPARARLMNMMDKLLFVQGDDRSSR